MYGFINTLPAGAGLIFAPNAPPVRIDTQADFLWMKSLYGATNANIRMTFQDSRLGRQFTTAPIILRSIASNFAGTPYPLTSPFHLITAGSNYIISGADASGAINVLRFVMQGARLRAGLASWEAAPGRWKSYKKEEPYVYNLPGTPGNPPGVTTVPALQTLSSSITIENDAPFLIQNMTGEHNGALGGLLVDIRDSTADDQAWSNIPVPFETIFGNGQFPNILCGLSNEDRKDRGPYRVVGGKGSPATLTMNVQNLTAGIINYEVAFGGLKLFQ